MLARIAALGALGISHATDDDEYLFLLQAQARILKGTDQSTVNESVDSGIISVCAYSENQDCHCTGTVFYGRKYVHGTPGSGATTSLEQLKSSNFKSHSGTVSCSNNALGDPLPGVYKHCLCQPEHASSPVKSRHSQQCLDYNYNTHNVFMHNCHSGTNQKWYMDNERLTTDYDDKCLDMDYNNNNVYMHGCHGGSNQQWYFDGEDLKTRYDASKCLDMNPNGGNIHVHACHGGNNQKFYYTHPISAAYASKVKSAYTSKCMDHNNGNIFFNDCNDHNSQKFYMAGWALKSYFGDKCVDYHYGDQDNVAMWECHGGSNQQWYFDGKHLKTNKNDKCLDVHMENHNVYMHTCHSGSNQDFYLESVIQGLDHDDVADELEQEDMHRKDCKGWCSGKKHENKAWIGGKCAWKACAGCSQCSE